MKEITIVGAGLSGTLLAINLLMQNCREEVHIRLVDRHSSDSLGPAYSTNEDYLLNVPAEIMGAFSDRPDHFLNWALDRNIPAEKGAYLPRRLYREYVHDVFQKAFLSKKDNISFEHLQGEAADLRIIDGRPVLYLDDGTQIRSDKVVLALGNSLPRNPDLKSRTFIDEKRYIRNPWDQGVPGGLSPDDTVFFIGTGQTTVDIAVGLFKKKHRGKMISISRKGFFPLMQKKVEPYPSFYDELKDLKDISSVLHIVRKHIRIAEEKGLDPRSVIDSLRPHTKNIWMNLLPEEKRRFLRHVFRYWEIIRSRIPPASMEILNKLRSSGQLEVLTGRITDIIPSEHKMEINYRERGSKEVKSVAADVVINCIGPCQDYEQIDHPFIRSLINSRLIHCDPAHLGINALPEGPVIKEDGTPSDKIFTIGLPLKGIVWESLAAPEIRTEAEVLAKILVSGSG
jgi:uncharacterized NAD(P)/FAD-binding protein YdhS